MRPEAPSSAISAEGLPMRYTAASDTEPKLSALLDAAQREPVFIERDQQAFTPRL
jgi:hypothetical protein